MREQPWYLPAAAAALVIILAGLRPRRFWARSVIVYAALAVGYIGGHVFW